MFSLKHKKNDMFLKVFLPDGTTCVTDRIIFNPSYTIKEYERYFKVLFGAYFFERPNMDTETFRELWDSREHGYDFRLRLQNDYIQEVMEVFSKMEVFSYIPSKPKLKQDWRHYKFTSKGIEFAAYRFLDIDWKGIETKIYNKKNKVSSLINELETIRKEIKTLTDYGLTPQIFLYYFCGKDIREDVLRP